MSDFQDVGQFHHRFGLTHTDCANGYDSSEPSCLPSASPQPWDPDLIEFRRKFLQEELDEFTEGVNEHGHAKMFDALIDLVYVALGTAQLLGYPWQDGWDVVQRANLRKV